MQKTTKQISTTLCAGTFARTVAGSLPLSGLMVSALVPALLLSNPSVAAEALPTVTGWSTQPSHEWPQVIEPQAVTIDGKTDIRWVPTAYTYKAGSDNRYIDFDQGDDNNTGTSPELAWKHHPWDAQAQGVAAAASGVRSYVFKGGVVYRGSLIADESGVAGNPITLSRDPAWGNGPASLAGSLALSDWQRVADPELKAHKIPSVSAGQLWVASVPGQQVPRAAWFQRSPGTREALKIARWPNWEITHPYNHFTQWFRINKSNFAFPWIKLQSDDIKGADAAALKSATVWADHPNKSGEFSIYGPFPSRLRNFDSGDGSFLLELEHPARFPGVNTPFFLENAPQFLDQAGEWWFDEDTRRCYVWLPGDADPTASVVEVAMHEIILDIQGQQHIDVGGLHFIGGNTSDLRNAPDVEDYNGTPGTAKNCAIRLTGNCQFIDLHHLAVEDCAGTAIGNLITDANDVVRNIQIRDSSFYRLDTAGVFLERGFTYRRVESQPKGRLTNLSILRNDFKAIGFRSNSSGSGQGISLNGIEICDIAGNVMYSTTGQGINVVGGRPGAAWMGGNAVDTPLVRVQIHNNKVVDSLLYRTDFGGIEFWGNGPAYIYNNISANPIGFVAHRGVYHKNQAFYVDHGIKSYIFNNIGWSERREDGYKGIVGDHFLHEIRNRFTEAFHNTAYCFRKGQTHSSQHGDQTHYLANVFVDCYFGAISHWTLDSAAEIAYANNIAAGKTAAFYDRWRGETYVTAEEFAKTSKDRLNMIAANGGWQTDDQPLRDPENRDFRPTDTSAVIDRGVQVFVPWSLSGEVGEWHFRRHDKDPQTVLAYDVYMQNVYKGQTPHLDGVIPMNNLQAPGYTADDYTAGPLEDWVDGALRLDGQRILRLTNTTLTTDFVHKSKKADSDLVIAGEDRQTVRMGTNNFLIEVVLFAQSDGIIAGKIDANGGPGYALRMTDGYPVMQLLGQDVELQARGAQRLTDGKWHHVIAEVDRATAQVTLYIDGKTSKGSVTGSFPVANISFDNSGDFVVGDGFVGALDYLRVARGTLADAETTIDELMTWQFHGPQMHDFAGQAPTGGIRDAGALEHPTVSGRQTITYSPPVVVAKEDDISPDDAKRPTFKTDDTRLVTAFDWGSVSVPKAAAPGEIVDFQVVFGTETVEKEQVLRVDIHGWRNGKRVTNAGGSGEKPKVTPGVTTPYEARLNMPATDSGFEKITLVFYLSPDGSWSSKTLDGSVSVDYLATVPK